MDLPTFGIPLLLEIGEEEMNEKDEKRFGEMAERIRALEANPQAAKVPVEPLTANWLKRNAHWFFPIITLIFGSGFIFGRLQSFFGDLVDHRIESKLSEPIRDIQQIKVGVATVSTRLEGLLDLVKPLIAERIRASASLPEGQLQKELPQIKAAAVLAREERVVTPPEPIRVLGERVIGMAATQSDFTDLAWQTATVVFNYRSSSNVINPVAAVSVPLGNSGVTWRYALGNVARRTRPKLTFTEQSIVPTSRAARANFIGVNANSALDQGPLYLVATGGAASLDKCDLHNVIFDTVEIHYSGGQTILENVAFVNCTFVMDNTVPARKLGGEMLASGSVNFRYGA